MKIVVFSELWKKKSMVAIGVIVFLLMVTGFFGYEYKTYRAKVNRSNALQVMKPVQEQGTLAAIPDFFTEYRLERDKIRSERADILRDILKNAKSDDTKHRIQEAMLKIALEKQREAEMENLIKAKGFSDALVFFRDNSVSAVVKTTALSREEVMQVADIISRVSGVKAEDITISAKP